MAAGLQLIARGLATLQTQCGEPFRLIDTDEEFTAVRQEKERVLPDMGTVIDTELLALRSAFAALPVEGAIIENTADSAQWRVSSVRPGPTGHIVITVTAEAR